MLSVVTAKDVGFPEAPGEYHIDDVVYEVGARHISEWKGRPEAGFRTIKHSRINDERLCFVLGTLAPDQA